MNETQLRALEKGLNGIVLEFFDRHRATPVQVRVLAEWIAEEALKTEGVRVVVFYAPHYFTLALLEPEVFDFETP
jgi:hypothetical protein